MEERVFIVSVLCEVSDEKPAEVLVARLKGLATIISVVDPFIGDFLGLIYQFIHGVVVELDARFASVIVVIRVDGRQLVLGLRDVLG